jgi:hypothetical protein
MHLGPHSLRQIDDAYLQSWEVEALRGLSARLLADLKEAWDRLNQGPENSSRPPSSRAPWERPGGVRESDADAEADAEAADGDLEPAPVEAKPAEAKPAEAKPAQTPAARKPGKQPGAPGIGRTQVSMATRTDPLLATKIDPLWDQENRQLPSFCFSR